MKKLLPILLSLALVFTLAACSGSGTPEAAETPDLEPAPAPVDTPTPEPEPEPPPGPVAEEVMGVTIPAFEVFVNGISVTHEMMAAYPVYSVQATSVNSSGTETTATYIGFAISDVLEAAGLADNYIWLEATASDGYTVHVTGEDVLANTTLLAMTKDGAPFGEGPWLAPCTDLVSGNYLKGTVSILVNTIDAPPDMQHTLDGGQMSISAGLIEVQDRTDRVEFEPFSFLVNGNEVTNETLDGLNIFRITVITENRSGEKSDPTTYTGYNLAAVLDRLGITDVTLVKAVAADGFEAEYDGDILTGEYTLVAIERDRETGENGTIWLAPCAETSSGRYARDVVELIAE